MNYLLDTCVISEFIRPKPSRNVIQWIRSVDENYLYVSVLTFGELHKGIEKLVESKGKDELHHWVKHDLEERFRNRIAGIDLSIAAEWGKLQGSSEKAGRPMHTIDSLIAATGIVHRFTVVTRNTDDMKKSGVALLNPWE